MQGKEVGGNGDGEWMSGHVWWGNRYRIDIGVRVLGEIAMGG